MLVMEKTGADALGDAEWPCEVTFTRGNFVKKESIPSAVCSWCRSVLKAEIQAAREADYNRTIRLPPGDKSCGPCRIFRWTTSWLQSAGDYRPEEDYFTLEIIPDSQLDLLFFSITQYRADPHGPVKTIEVKETPLFRTDSCNVPYKRAAHISELRTLHYSPNTILNCDTSTLRTNYNYIRNS